MKERPILFSGPMVRAILEGRKTQTRRIVKPQPVGQNRAEPGDVVWFGGELQRVRESRGRNKRAAGDLNAHSWHPYGVPGDRLYVKETWRPVWHGEMGCCVQYAADSSYRKPKFQDTNRGLRFADLCDASGDNAEPWHPSIHMWREMSRLTLEVVSVRVERLHEISEADAKAEGVAWMSGGPLATALFEALWKSINGPDSWPLNPWVWVIEFKMMEGLTK